MSTTGFNPMPADDVESCLRECSDAFGQLAALLNIIKEKAPEYSEAAKLAALGCYIATDMENYADATREQVRKGGIAQT